MSALSAPIKSGSEVNITINEARLKLRQGLLILKHGRLLGPDHKDVLHTGTNSSKQSQKTPDEAVTRLEKEVTKFQKEVVQLFPLTSYPEGISPKAAIIGNAVGRKTDEYLTAHVKALESAGIPVFPIQYPAYGTGIPGEPGEVYDFEHLAQFQINWITRISRQYLLEGKADPFVRGAIHIGHSLSGLVHMTQAKILSEQEQLGDNGAQKRLMSSIITISSPLSASWEKDSIPNIFNITRTIAYGSKLGDVVELTRKILFKYGLFKNVKANTVKLIRDNDARSLCACYTDIMFNTNWDEVCSNVYVPTVAIVSNSDTAVLKGGWQGEEVIPGSLLVRRPGEGHGIITPELLKRIVVSTDVREQLGINTSF